MTKRKLKFLFVVIVVLWAGIVASLSFAYAATKESSETSSTGVYIALAVFGLINALIAYIYTSGQKDLKEDIKTLKIDTQIDNTEIKAQVIRLHERIDEICSQYLLKIDHKTLCEAVREVHHD